MNSEPQIVRPFRPGDKVMGYIPSSSNQLVAGEITEITREAGVSFYVIDDIKRGIILIPVYEGVHLTLFNAGTYSIADSYYSVAMSLIKEAENLKKLAKETLKPLIE